jgi:transposase InsO family protein
VWVEQDIRDWVVEEVLRLSVKTDLGLTVFIRWLGIPRSKFYAWLKRYGEPLRHNGQIPRSHWLLSCERDAILAYARSHPGEGYRRLTYMMLDENIAAVSPSSTYRVLLAAGLLKRWNTAKNSAKGSGFVQPTAPHQHWHTDIKYVNFRGTFLFLITVIDGFSRYIVHHELRTSMQEFDIQITIQRALDKFPGVKPRIISDNGPQFISKDFAEFLRQMGLQHVRTSIAYPQSNGKVERWHGTITQECLRQRSFINLDDARRQIAQYIEIYNTKRLHSSLFYLTPEEVLTGKTSERIEERERKLEEAAQKRRQLRSAA